MDGDKTPPRCATPKCGWTKPADFLLSDIDRDSPSISGQLRRQDREPTVLLHAFPNMLVNARAVSLSAWRSKYSARTILAKVIDATLALNRQIRI